MFSIFKDKIGVVLMKKPPIVLDPCGNGAFIVNLQYIAHEDRGQVKNTLGTGFDIPLVDDENAGLMSPDMLESLIGASQIQTEELFADIGVSTQKRFIHITNDETNGGESTLYFHDSVGLNYIPMQKLY